MRTGRESRVERRTLQSDFTRASASVFCPRLNRAFTLIEVMIVVAIMGVILAMGLPPVFRSLRPESVRKAASDLKDVCNNARARAIMNGTEAEVVFHPLERRFEVSGGGDTKGGVLGAGLSGRLPDDVTIELLEVNLRNCKEEESATVKFFPNGTSDQMHVVFKSDKDEWRAITLEMTTGLVDIDTDMKRLEYK